MASDRQWRWVDRKGVQRALSADALHEALRLGALGRDVPVWRDGMDSFEPVQQVLELAESSRTAPASTPVGAAPVGVVVAATPASQKALQNMVHREKSKRTQTERRRQSEPAGSPRPTGRPILKPNQTPTVPPPSRAKKTAAWGSRPFPGNAIPTPPPPRSEQNAPPPPSPVTPPRVSTPVAVPPPPIPEAKTSPAAMTIGAGMQAQSPPANAWDLPEDTPPATPIALTASGRRSSSPRELEPPGGAAGPAPNVPAAPPPVTSERADQVPTIPPSRLDMTRPSATMRSEAEQRLAREKRLRILIPVAGGLGGLIAIVMLGLVIMIVVSDDEPLAPAGATSGSAAPAASAPVASPPAQSATAPAKPAVACVYRGPRKRLVIGASKDVPLEVWSDPEEPLLAVGFAARNLTALGFVLDPTTLRPQRSYSKKVGRPIQRVVPVRSGQSISFETNAQDPSDSVRNPLTVPTVPPVRLGTFKNSLTISVEGESVPEILWQLPFSGSIEAMRTVAVPGKGFGLVFRAQDALWLGWVDTNRKPLGALHKIPGTGIKVGAPSIGWNGQQALITFANLNDSKSPWNIRMASVQFGERAGSSSEWAVPEGGPGGAAIAPTLRGVHDGRWIMVWTEGKAGARSVRVQTYDTGMQTVGEAFTVSRPGSNAGQGMAVVGPSGGAVFYFAIIGTQYEVWGAGIECP